MDNSKLLEFRNRIDAVDDEILKLIAKRTDIVVEVGKLKNEVGTVGNFIKSGREAQKVRDVVMKGAGKFPVEVLYNIWREIIAASLNLENGLRIAIPAGQSFEFHKSAIAYFGNFVNYREYQYDENVLDAIDNHTVGVFTLESGWWLNLAEQKYQDLKVFARLGKDIFAVAKVQPEPSGNDKTIAIARDGNILATHGKVKLVEVNGFHNEIEDAVVIGNYGV